LVFLIHIEFFNNLCALVGQIKDLILSTCTMQLRRCSLLCLRGSLSCGLCSQKEFVFYEKMNFIVCYEFWGSCVFFLLALQQFREPNRHWTSDMHAHAVGGFIGRNKLGRSVLTCTLRAAVNCLQIGASWLMFWTVNRVKCSWGTFLRRSSICHSLADWEMTMRLDTAA